MLEKKLELNLSAEEVAQAFCAMSSEEMAKFFAECKRLSQGPDWAAGGIYAQALWVRQDMKVGTPGADFLMDLAAPWYAHTLRYIDAHGERERA